MGIIFENIDTGESISIDRQTEGNFYRAKLSAVMNSSNMSINADRGQDFGWRLQPEQQALLEEWEDDPEMIDRVGRFTKVPNDSLTHAEFLSYMLYQQELGKSPEKRHDAARRDNQLDYQARVNSLRELKRPEAMPAFNHNDVIERGKETLENFLNGELTGDAGGDKEVTEDDLPPVKKTRKPRTKKPAVDKTEEQ